MADCGNISIGSDPDCDDLPVGGTEPNLWVINWTDLDDDAPFTYDVNGKITDIVLKAGKVAYAYVGFRNDMKVLSEVVNPGVGPNGVKQTGGLVIYDRTQIMKNNIRKFIKGKFVFISKLKGRDDDSLIVMGAKVGLEIVPGGIYDAHANGGYYILSFASPEGEMELGLPITLGTTYQDGLDIITDLLSS